MAGGYTSAHAGSMTIAALLSLTSHELRQPTGRGPRLTCAMLDHDLTLGQKARKVDRGRDARRRQLVALLDEIGELARLKDQAVRLTLKSMSLRSVLHQAVQAAALPDRHDVELDVVAPADVRRRVDEGPHARRLWDADLRAGARQTGAATIDLRLMQDQEFGLRVGDAAIAVARQDRGQADRRHARRHGNAAADRRRHRARARRQAARALGRRPLVRIHRQVVMRRLLITVGVAGVAAVRVDGCRRRCASPTNRTAPRFAPGSSCSPTRNSSAPPPDVIDCAALVRHAVREALKAHTPEWMREARLPFTPRFADVRSGPRPTPQGWPLFRVVDGGDAEVRRIRRRADADSPQQPPSRPRHAARCVPAICCISINPPSRRPIT